jgi:very-short-patch-repair endonuclease
MERRGRGLLPLSREVAASFHLRLHPVSFPSFSFDFATSSSIWFGTNQSRDNDDPKNHLLDRVRLSRGPPDAVTWVTGTWRRLPFDGRVNKREIERCLQLLAGSQHGVVGLRQLLDGGVSRGVIRGLCNRGRLRPILPRVFRVDAAPMTKRMRCMATVLWAGPAVASGRTSAELHGLLDHIAGPIEVTGPVNRTPRPGILHRRRTIEDSQKVDIDNIPALCVAHTLLELCGSLAVATCEIALDAALREGLVVMNELRAVLAVASKRRLRGSRTLRELVAIRGDDEALSESELESTVFRLLRGVDYPLPQRQVTVDLGDRRGRVDFIYPEANLVIEVDGRRWHAGRRPEIRDRRRDHSLVLGRKRVLRFTWEDVVHEPEYFLQVVGKALGLIATRSIERGPGIGSERERLPGNGRGQTKRWATIPN